MASLIFAAGFLTYNKVKDRRDAKKEKKRQQYESRYSDLQREHTQDEERRRKSLGAETQSPVSTGTNNPFYESKKEEDSRVVGSDRRVSSESQRSHNGEGNGDADGPGAWVDHVLREKERKRQIQRTGSSL